MMDQSIRVGLFVMIFSRIDKRIKVFHKLNEGLGLTRNKGIKEAHGDYICFIDSDDYIEENILKQYMLI